MTDIVINDSTLAEGKPNRSGYCAYARFSLQLSAVSLKPCALLRNKKGRLCIATPRGKSNLGHKFEARIQCERTTEEVLDRVLDVYEALTGRNLEHEVETEHDEA